MHTPYRGSTWAELSKLAGDDPKAIVILSHLLDAAEEDVPVDIPMLREFCSQPTTTVTGAMMDSFLATAVTYIHDWLWETDEKTVHEYEQALLGGLFSLRTGEFPCWTCQETAWNLNLLQPREPGSVDCHRHHAITVYDIVSPRTPLLRAVG